MIRTFIGIPVPITPELVFTREVLMKKFYSDRVRWIEPTQLHITLCFLGEISFSLLLKIRSNFKETYAGVSAIESNLVGLGTFGKKSNPSILWTGIDNAPNINELQKITYNYVGPLVNIKVQKPYFPHVTLARIKVVENYGLFNEIMVAYQNTQFGKMDIKKVIFYKSILTSLGPVYEAIDEVKLS